MGGMSGVARMWSVEIRKGTMPSQASPSQVSSVRLGGRWAAIVAAGIGQWAKSRSLQTCHIAQGRAGTGHGLPRVAARIAAAGARMG